MLVLNTSRGTRFFGTCQSIPSKEIQVIFNTVAKHPSVALFVNYMFFNSGLEIGPVSATRPNGFAETLSFFLEFSVFSLSFEFFPLKQHKL